MCLFLTDNDNNFAVRTTILLKTGPFGYIFNALSQTFQAEIIYYDRQQQASLNLFAIHFCLRNIRIYIKM